MAPGSTTSAAPTPRLPVAMCQGQDLQEVIILTSFTQGHLAISKVLRSRLANTNPFFCSFLYVTETGDQPENCKLYGHGNFSTVVVEGAHYTYVTDPPTEPAELCSTECPGADAQIYASVTGEVSVDSDS